MIHRRADRVRALRAHFAALEETSDEPGVNAARGYACEFVAWQFLTNLSEREAIDFLLYELPPTSSSARSNENTEENSTGHHNGNAHSTGSEETPLLASSHSGPTQSYFGTDTVQESTAASAPQSDEFSEQFENLSALEIAAVSGSKKFISQRPVQKIINGVWRGDIVFWETLSVNSVKCPKLYNRKRADPFCRLRVPRYLKIYETCFFAMFLALYYAVLVRRSFTHVRYCCGMQLNRPLIASLCPGHPNGNSSLCMDSWLCVYPRCEYILRRFLTVLFRVVAYDEFGEWSDAGQTSFYASDFWWTWDIVSILAFKDHAARSCLQRVLS
jgi:hypothetical protein